MLLSTLVVTAIVSSVCSSSSSAGTPIPNLKIIGVVHPPFLNAADANGNFSGFIIDLLKAMGKAGSFTFDFSIQADGNQGTRLDNGTTTGALDRLVKKEFDVEAVDFTISEARDTAVDFLHPFYQTQNRVLVNVADAASNFTNVKYLVFSSTVQKWLQTATVDPRLVAINANVQANLPESKVSSIAAGVALVLKGGYALVLDLPDGYFAVKANPGKLKLTNDVLLTKFFGFAVQQGSPYTENLNLAFETVMESGTYQQLLDKHIPTGPSA